MKIAIYQTSDLHGYVYPTNYVDYQELGILKIASFIQNDEKNYDHSLKIDTGDLTQGSAMTHYLSKQNITQNPIVNLLDKVSFDAFVIGNHEFNYGLDYLKNSYKQVEDKILNSNIKGLPLKSKPYEIFNFDGYRIAVVGATTVFIPNWEQASTIEGMEFLDPIETFKSFEDEVVKNSDLVIYAYHGGFEKSIDGMNTPTEKLTKENQASEILENFTSIDILLSGHQHRSFITKLNEVICAQPINNGGNFTKIVVDTQTLEITYELIDVESLGQTINPELEEDFTKLNEDLEVYLDTKIGEFSEDILMYDLFEARLHSHPFINFIHDVQLDISHADFSSICIFDTAKGFEKEVTIRDVLINYPYPNTLKVLEISGHKLKEAIEISATYFVLDDTGSITINRDFLVPKIQNYNYDLYRGLDYIIDISRPFGDRVISMTKDGIEFDLDANYTIVLNNYRATNTSKYPAYENAKLIKDINMDMSEIIINYFEKYGKIQIKSDSNFKVIGF